MQQKSHALCRDQQSKQFLTVLPSWTTNGDTSSSALVPFWPFGNVYAAWNPLFPDLIKIGATIRQKPYMRVAELSTSGVPEPFQLVDSIACKDPFALEKEIHAHYNAVRKYGRKNEFYIVSREEILEYFHIISFKATLLQPLRSGSNNHPKKQARSEAEKSGKNESQQAEVDANNIDDDKEDKKRKKQRRTFETEEEEESFKASVKNFVENSITVSDDKNDFVSTRKLKNLFDSLNESRIVSDNNFFRELKKQMASFAFPPTVVCKRKGDVTGYFGIASRG